MILRKFRNPAYKIIYKENNISNLDISWNLNVVSANQTIKHLIHYTLKLFKTIY